MYGDCDRWFRHVEEVTAVMMQDISRVCMVAGLTCHVDMTKPQRGKESGHLRRCEFVVAGRTANPPGRALGEG